MSLLRSDSKISQNYIYFLQKKTKEKKTFLQKYFFFHKITRKIHKSRTLKKKKPEWTPAMNFKLIKNSLELNTIKNKKNI